jgi:hypothetical protein
MINYKHNTDPTAIPLIVYPDPLPDYIKSRAIPLGEWEYNGWTRRSKVCVYILLVSLDNVPTLLVEGEYNPEWFEYQGKKIEVSEPYLVHDISLDPLPVREAVIWRKELAVKKPCTLRFPDLVPYKEVPGHAIWHVLA